MVLEACAIRLLFVAFFPKVELMCGMIHSCKVYNVMAVGTAVGLQTVTRVGVRKFSSLLYKPH